MKQNYNYDNNLDYENSNNEKETDFDYKRIIIPLLEKADKKKENVILLTTGSFNPIHRMHLEILNIAYKHLLSLKQYNILCAFISPSADCYVKYKRPPLIPFDLRCKMIQTSIDEFYEENKNKEKEILKIFLHKWEGSHSYFIDFPEVTLEIQKKLYEVGDIKLLYVCGMDHYIKCFYSFQRNVVVIERKPFQKEYKRYQSNPKKLIFIVRDENCEPYSSTYIRESHKINDLDAIRKSAFPKTAEMIINFFNEIYSK